MAGEKKEDKQAKLKEIRDLSSSTAAGCKLNPNAREFVPNSFIQMTIPNYLCQYFEFINNGEEGRMRSDCIGFEDPKSVHFIPDLNDKALDLNMNTADLIQKIVKQVEYQFSDANLIASNFLVKIMNKDPEGNVPISVIAAWKKIKKLGVNNQMLIKALRTSSKLVVSEDGIKVRRKKLFTEKDKEELMLRTVIVENLSEGSSRQSIEKIFSIIGSVKNIIICHPQESNSTRSSKSDKIISKKLHALVEFETADQADKAVEKLNDESNWRRGLRVRPMTKPTPRSIIRGKRSDHGHFDLNSEDGHSLLSQNLESPNIINVLQQSFGKNQNGAKQVWGRGRGKPNGLVQNNNGRSVLSKNDPKGAQKIGHGVCENYIKHASLGPRMPDGTRGFTMGRGKPLKQPMTANDYTPIML